MGLDVYVGSLRCSAVWGDWLEAMLDWMVEEYGLSRLETLALASLVVGLRITQIVNGVRGVHALLPHGAVQRG